MESFDKSVCNFAYAEDGGVTFEVWYKRYEDLFTVDAAKLDDAARTRFVLRKLGTAVHTKYVNHILPKNPRELTFVETVRILTELFGQQRSQFSVKYQCLKLVKQTSNYFVAFGGIVNREREEFKLAELSIDHFKCLIFAEQERSVLDLWRSTQRTASGGNVHVENVVEGATKKILTGVNPSTEAPEIQNWATRKGP